MSEVIVIGGGPAGMMAAITAARTNQVIIIEQNEKLGKKLYITGKGRCNITNMSDVENHIQQVVHNPKFLYSALYSFDADMAMNFFSENGLKMKVERGNRVFPESDKASDVIKIFEKTLRKSNVKVQLNTKVQKCYKEERGFIVKTNLGDLKCDKLIIATGGVSYQQTGSTGDGYKFAKQFKHKVVSQQAGLIGLDVNEATVADLQGVALKNVEISIKKQDQLIHQEFGEMLFTHFGLSGPIIITASSYMNQGSHQAYVDLKPKLTYEKLDKRILRDFEKYNNKDIINGLDDLLPKKLIPYIIDRTGINPRNKIHQISKEERSKLVEHIKGLRFDIKGKHQMNQAIITQGGVTVKEINPNTMESKLVPGLYFAGEMIDVDALTGGYNLQIAYATGYLAGISLTN